MSWEDIRKQLNEHDNFGRELKKKLPSGFIPADILAEKDEMEKQKVLAFAQKALNGTVYMTLHQIMEVITLLKQR